MKTNKPQLVIAPSLRTNTCAAIASAALNYPNLFSGELKHPSQHIARLCEAFVAGRLIPASESVQPDTTSSSPPRSNIVDLTHRQVLVIQLAEVLLIVVRKSPEIANLVCELTQADFQPVGTTSQGIRIFFGKTDSSGQVPEAVNTEIQALLKAVKTSPAS